MLDILDMLNDKDCMRRLEEIETLSKMAKERDIEINITRNEIIICIEVGGNFFGLYSNGTKCNVTSSADTILVDTYRDKNYKSINNAVVSLREFVEQYDDFVEEINFYVKDDKNIVEFKNADYYEWRSIIILFVDIMESFIKTYRYKR